jgi:hypothetical protein
MPSANRYLGGFGSSPSIFPPQIIQVLLIWCGIMAMLPRRGVIEGHFTWFGRWVELPASYWYTTLSYLSRRSDTGLPRSTRLTRMGEVLSVRR